MTTPSITLTGDAAEALQELCAKRTVRGMEWCDDIGWVAFTGLMQRVFAGMPPPPDPDEALAEQVCIEFWAKLNLEYDQCHKEDHEHIALIAIRAADKRRGG